jgi:hypothetical protein
VPAKLDVTVRPLGAAKRKIGWLAADLVWPARSALGDEQQPDIALLRLRKPMPESGEGVLPLFGLPGDVSEENEHAMKVLAVGFPRFKLVKGKGPERRESHQISGVVRPGSGLVFGNYEIENITFGSKNNLTPIDAAADWVGFSGAPLFANRHVIGLVTIALDRVRYDFRAVRLGPILKQRKFHDLVKGAATIASQTAQAEVPPIVNLVCLLDRDDQEGDFIHLHKRCCPAAKDNEPPPPVQPLICLLPGAGEFRHEPEDLADRLAIKTLPDLAWPKGSTTFAWIEWPATNLDPEVAIARLRASLWNKLCGGGDAPDKAQAFRDLWKDGSRVRLFKSDLTQRALSPDSARVLAKWSSFLAEIAPPDPRPLGHLMLLSGTLGRAREWRALANAPAHVVIEVLAELDRCTPIDLRKWLNDRLPTELGAAHKSILERLQVKLEAEFEERFYISPLKRRVRELTKEGADG